MHSKDGERYVENPDHVPNPADLYGTLSTQPWGPTRLQDVSTAVAQDKTAVAEQIKAALDPEDTTVGADKVMFPEGQTQTVIDPEAQRKEVLARADAQLEQGVTYPGDDLAADAALDGDEGVAAASGAEGNVSDGALADNSNSGENATKANSPAKSQPAKKTAAKKTASSRS